jgi:hypothetical protein
MLTVNGLCCAESTLSRVASTVLYLLLAVNGRKKERARHGSRARFTQCSLESALLTVLRQDASSRLRLRGRTIPAKPSKPVPRSVKVAGSGVVIIVGGEQALKITHSLEPQPCALM